MAVSQSSDHKPGSPARDKHLCREVANADARGLPHQGKPNGASSRCLKMIVKASEILEKSHLSRSRTKILSSDNLSDISDAEVTGYLNTTEETRYKRILWEAMNEKYVNAKKQKVSISTKKNASRKKAANPTEKVELQQQSSRINYDALKIFNEKWEHDPPSSETVNPDACIDGSQVSPSKIIYTNMHDSNEINAFQLDAGDDEDEETSECHNFNLYDEFGNEHFEDDYSDFD